MKTSLILVSLSFLFFSQARGLETVKGARKDMAAFKQEMNVKLADLEQQLALLRSKARTKGNAAGDKAVTELEKSRDQIKAELGEMEKNGDSKWKKMKKNIAVSFDRLNNKVQKLLQE